MTKVRSPRGVVVVTDGEQRAALAIVRSLGAAGYDVIVTSDNGRSLAGASRFARADVAVSNALTAPGDFAESLARLSGKEAADVVIPVTEPALLAALPARDRIHGVVPFPSLDAFRAISDKRALLNAAAELGISIPEQRVALDAEELARIAPSLFYPVVVKPARSVGEANGARSRFGVRYAGGSSDLLRIARDMGTAAFPLLLQQRVIGPGVGIFMLLWEGQELARFAHRRIREKPPSGGVSVYRESIAADPSLVTLSRALLDRFSWEGVAMIEYKLDAATGQPYLMEVNGRFWGSLQLAIDAEVDFPRLLVEAAMGQLPKPVIRYREGVRSRWWWGEVDHLLARLRRSNARLALPPGSPGRVRAIADFLAIWRPHDRSEILRWSDPAPFARETLDWLRAL